MPGDEGETTQDEAKPVSTQQAPPPAPKLKTVVLPDEPGRELKVLRVGSQVLYVMASGPSVGESRPAICVRPTGKDCGNLKVDLDGEADLGQEDGEHRDTLSMRVVSVPFGSAEEPGTWYWSA